mmetsp:Transcript_127/g.151  ORF Transcript_127/g.151 Transcript_127/m.151 type:complete len:776 (-) Transcript_127:6-2333(-)
MTKYKCCCNYSDRCGIIQAHAEALGIPNMVGYVRLPSLPQSAVTQFDIFNTNRHKGYLRHLFSGSSDSIKGISRHNVARNHFHEEVLKKDAEQKKGTKFIQTISSDIGLAIGLTLIDKNSGTDDYFALPNQTILEMEAFIATKLAQSQARQQLQDTAPRDRISMRLSFSDLKDLKNEERIIELANIATAEKEKKLVEDNSINATLSGVQQDYVTRLQDENRELVREMQRKLDALQSKYDETSDNLDEFTAANTLFKEAEDDNKKMMSRSGLTRFNILNEDWHANNPLMSQHIFGFHTFYEFRVYCRCLFPDMDQDLCTYEGMMNDTPITEFEKCTMVLIRMRRKMTLETIALIFNRDRTSVGRFIMSWAPRWETVGTYLSDLDINEKYLKQERPQIFTDAGQDKIAIIVDGKDFMIHDLKSNSALKKAAWSDKTHHTSLRIITWSTAMGLSPYHSPLYLGRATESAIIALCGSYHSTVPLNQVLEDQESPEKFIKTENYQEKNPNLNNIVKENQQINNSKEFDEEDESEDDDDVDHNDLRNVEIDDELEEAKLGNENGSINLTKWGEDFLDTMRQRVDRGQKSGKKYSAEKIIDCNKLLLKGGPNSSNKEKLKQLTIHEALHQSYENDEIRKCQLSYYLKAIEPLRGEMLRHLKGQGGNDTPPIVYTNLAKIPVGMAVLADRGFYFDAPSYPNVNAQITPHFLTGRDQFESSEINKDLVTCRLRWSSEAVFSRITDLEALNDVIPYSYFSILCAMIEWGHARANLMQPFNEPTDY